MNAEMLSNEVDVDLIIEGVKYSLKVGGGPSLGGNINHVPSTPRSPGLSPQCMP